MAPFCLGIKQNGAFGDPDVLQETPL
jgi:hypothetical protein